MNRLVVFLLIAVMAQIAVAKHVFPEMSYEQFKETIPKALKSQHMPNFPFDTKSDQEEMSASQRKYYEEWNASLMELGKLTSLAPAQALEYSFRSIEDHSFSFENCVLPTNELYLAVKGVIDVCSGIELHLTLGKLPFVWMNDERNVYTGQTFIWWWYDGRRYVPKIWEEWYACWKEEMGREKPRPVVQDWLVKDIVMLRYNVYPYLYKAVTEGDTVLEKCLADNFVPIRCEDTWDFSNKGYTLPKCEGYESALARFSENPPYTKEQLADIRRWGEKAKRYYSNPNRTPAYWYHYLDPDDSCSDKDNLKPLDAAQREARKVMN